ncbi:2-isopropylmalate synthase [Skermania sp. ID1734]|uniref:alpha-isopropylmalate synthase regulatory domain-containing protein n=1 Tax=Skermania sp. ID1734 TaxID=2597516 RepID=UPI00117D9F7C|nr:alpha-isopropylmalate synthase regulatory domain-containing protein [Skermania sp. ID1734]TSE01440.1 2-isopropylmalate synthase [Skermania sp. ID1734]
MAFAAESTNHFANCGCAGACADPFARQYGQHLPKTLRAEASALSWAQFCERYSATSGPVRFGSLARSTSSRRGAAAFEATLAIDAEIITEVIDANGPMSALTGILYRRGISIEMLSFHQRETADGIATFVLCEHNGRRYWAAAIASNAVESQARALINAANRLLQNR